MLGGWPGGVLAEQLLRHKSLKASFRRAFWRTVAISICVLVVLARRSSTRGRIWQNESISAHPTMRHLVTLAFVVAAIAAYLASAGPGCVSAFFLAGMLCEGIAWFRVLRRDKSPPDA